MNIAPVVSLSSGVHDTLAALSIRQGDELYLSASLEELHAGAEEVGKQLVSHLPDNLMADNDEDATRKSKSPMNL